MTIKSPVRLIEINIKNYKFGLAAVELALVAPLVFLMLFGVINYSILLFDKSVITNAAREGARWASIHAVDSTCSTIATTTDPCGIVRTYLMDNLITFEPVTELTTIVTYDNTTAGNCVTQYRAGCLDTVTVTYKFTGIGYLWVSIIGNARTLSAISKMYHE